MRDIFEVEDFIKLLTVPMKITVNPESIQDRVVVKVGGMTSVAGSLLNAFSGIKSLMIGHDWGKDNGSAQAQDKTK